jgi:SAM-dependent methyltransferase
VTAETGDTGPVERYRRDYMRLRDREGRGSGGVDELLSLPFLVDGAMAKQWRVHARSFRALLKRIVEPLQHRVAPRPLTVLDVGAGNGWLCYRLARDGHRAVAVDLRLDDVDGLGAGAPYRGHLEEMFGRAAAGFDRLPFNGQSFDLAVFVSSLHCASDLGATIGEVARVVRPGGRIAVLDSPFYDSDAVGQAMVAERTRATHEHLGDLADGLLALDSIEYLTRDGLVRASAASGVEWRRHRVLYPLWYELRPVKAWLRRKRPPSRFDLWEGVAP